MSTNTIAVRNSDVKNTLAPSVCRPEIVYDDIAMKNMQFSLQQFYRMF
jgi:hypothetical protein